MYSERVYTEAVKQCDLRKKNVKGIHPAGASEWTREDKIGLESTANAVRVATAVSASEQAVPEPASARAGGRLVPKTYKSRLRAFSCDVSP